MTFETTEPSRFWIRTARRSLHPCSSVTHVQVAILKPILHLQLHAWAQIHCKTFASLSFPNHFRKRRNVFKHRIMNHHVIIFCIGCTNCFISFIFHKTKKYHLFYFFPHSLCFEDFFDRSSALSIFREWFDVLCVINFPLSATLVNC